MAISFVRTLISYALVVFALRIMGKRQVGELQPSELVVAIMISDLATIPMSDPALPLLSGIVPILTLISAEMSASLLSLKFPKIRKALTGSPAVIIKKGIICREEMRKNRYNLEDLAEGLRMKDYFDVDDVYMAILETNGSLSVIPKSGARPPTSDEAGIKGKQQTLPHVIIADGKKYPEHMQEAGVNDDWLKKQLSDRKITNANEVFLLTVDGDKKVTLQMKNKE
ncbi:MAG: DUF421 domain-containing protein [Clostridia bacterium]|nr:DUF421 domain-containing protein [Clostridia bacterium]